MKICKNYCGVACVDGSCPRAKQSEYEERGYDVIKKCEDCLYYDGCEDCYFNGNEEYPCEETKKYNQRVKKVSKKTATF